MHSRMIKLVRRAAIAFARRVLLSRDLFRALDELRAENAILAAERQVSNEQRDQAIALQLASDRQRDEAEKARWQAVREREEAEQARWTAVAEREMAERARWAAVRQREDADAALRQALVGYRVPLKQKELTNEGSFYTPLTRSNANPARKPNGAKIEQGVKISVILPNFNHGAFIKDNIEGVCAQTYANWEL